MGLYGMMVTSASGMAAQANLLGTVSDNVANSDTVGYKRATEEFSSLVLQSGVAEYNSGSVESHLRRIVDDQGALNYTSSPTDLAIKGHGFFIVTAPDGTTSLTRAGAFVQDSDGNLVNAAGAQLLGYPAATGVNAVINGFAGLVPVNVGALGPVVQPTTAATLSVNLPPESPAISAANLPSANTAIAQYTKMTSLSVFDSVGASQTLDIYETKTGVNTWELAIFDRSQAAAGGTFPYASGPLAAQTLSFDPATGEIAAPPVTMTVPVPNGTTMTLDLSGCTELAGGYSVRTAQVNGSAPSAVDHLEVGAAGQVNAIYKNGSSATVFQIPVATVNSPDKLEARPGNMFVATIESGNVLVGLPQSGSFGSIVSNALEKSNVDLAAELTTMIAAQHSYTANSKVFQTAGDLLDVLINMKR